ncbi:MAG: hypothetical protein J0L78_08655 [Planctomycetes bacterium]|nr:hypothetical protein [Planctomycetota bacterium]
MAWTEVLGRKRPGHLDLFREFPSINSKELGDSVRGTLIHSEDATWLTQFMDDAVATVYFLGDKPSGRPAECFTYLRINLREDGGAEDFAQFNTKHGMLIETGTSIAVSPPLVTRGHSTDYRIDTTRTASATLLGLLDKNPLNRLVVAVRQYFRTQFSDLFSSTPAEDFATYCSCLEAAFDIDGRYEAGDKFVGALCGMFGKEERQEEFFRGLYSARSVYVHGVSDESIVGATNMEAVAYRSFVTRPWKLTLLRQLTRAVLLRQLGEPPNAFGFLTPDSPDIILSKVLQSSAIWEKIRPLLTEKGAADALTNMDEEAFHKVEELAVGFKEEFAWECVLDAVEVGAMYRSICTCAIMIGRLTGSAGTIYAASHELGSAAHNRDGKSIREWCSKHSDWEDVIVLPRDRLRAMQAFMWALANFFVVKG